MTVSVVVPYRSGCPYRDAAYAWVRAKYETRGWEVVTGASPEGPFSRSAAILDAAHNSSGQIVVVADADAWCDGVTRAVDVVTGGAPWAMPHRLIHRLSPESTDLVLAGADWRGLPLSTDNIQDSRPYRGHETGTLVVFQRDVLFDVPPDPRFVGWGQEDDAWACALRVLVGHAWRGSADLVHLWHPEQPRESRRIGNQANRELWWRYRAARSRGAMRALIDERTADACIT